MAYSVNTFPAQQLPYSRKGDKWRKQCVDWGCCRTYEANELVRGSVEHMCINYDLVNGRIHVEDFAKVIEPDKFSIGFIPDDIQHYPIINPKINLLVGEESKRVFEMRVVVTNPNAVSDIERNKANALREKYIAFLQGSQQEQEQDQKQIADIQRYINYEWQDMREIRANALLHHYDKELNIGIELNAGFKDAITVGQEMYKLDIVSGEPTLERLNPLNVHVYRSGNSNKIEDADIIVVEDYWAVGRVYDVFYDALTQKDRDYIEHIAEQDGAGDDDEEERRLMEKAYSGSFIGEDGVHFTESPMKYANIHNDSHLAPFDTSGNIRVVRVYWKSRKKILKVKSYDEITGETIYNLFPEGHIVNEDLGEEVETLWVNEAWEGTKIGEQVYVNIRPMQMQFNRLSNPSRCHFGIIGSIYNLNEDRPFSLVDMMKPYNYMYDVIHNRLNKAIAKHWGNMLELDIAALPNDMDMEKWLYYAKECGIVVKDSFREGNRGAATGKLYAGLNTNSKGVIPMDMGSTIQSYINYLEYLKKEMSEVVGITPQREGSISNRETVGGVERATVQSSHITEWLFMQHNDVKKRVYEAFLEVAKVAMRGRSLKFSHILSDNSLQIMNIDGDEFAECDYGLCVDYSNDAQALKQNLEALAQAALQTQALSFSNIMKLYGSSSLAEKQRMIEQAEQESQQRQQEAQQQQEKQLQMQLQNAQQIAQQQNQLQLQIKREENQTRIKVAQIEAMTKYETTERQDPTQFEKELAEDRRQFDEKIGIEKEKIEVDKMKIESQNSSNERINQQANYIKSENERLKRDAEERMKAMAEENKFLMNERNLSQSKESKR